MVSELYIYIYKYNVYVCMPAYMHTYNGFRAGMTRACGACAEYQQAWRDGERARAFIREHGHNGGSWARSGEGLVSYTV